MNNLSFRPHFPGEPFFDCGRRRASSARVFLATFKKWSLFSTVGEAGSNSLNLVVRRLFVRRAFRLALSSAAIFRATILSPYALVVSDFSRDDPFALRSRR
jgi:hypothetical protein